MRTTLLCAFAVAFGLLRPAAADSAGNNDAALGRWHNTDATFEVFTGEGGTLAARIIALQEPLTPDGKTKTDIFNPDPAKRARPIVGLTFMRGFTPTGAGHWEKGTIYDPKSGKTYSCTMELDGATTLKVRGYLGISALGRTEVWTRVGS